MFAMFSAKKLLDEHAPTDLDFQKIVDIIKQLKDKK
jgi:protein-tyrosine phosphatase